MSRFSRKRSSSLKASLIKSISKLNSQKSNLNQFKCRYKAHRISMWRKLCHSWMINYRFSNVSYKTSRKRWRWSLTNWTISLMSQRIRIIPAISLQSFLCFTINLKKKRCCRKQNRCSKKSKKNNRPYWNRSKSLQKLKIPYYNRIKIRCSDLKTNRARKLHR